LSPLSSSSEPAAASIPNRHDVLADSTEKRRQVAALQSYQLTHDYLVPPLRQWLTQKQRETWRGRAELRLAQRTAQWMRTREARSLPSLLEYLSVVFGVARRKRTEDQRRLMRAAGRYHGLRWSGVLAGLVAAALAIQQYVLSIRHTADQRRAETAVKALFSAPPAGVPYTTENLEPLRSLAVPLLRERVRDAAADAVHRLHAAYALARLDGPDAKVQAFLLDSVPTAPGAEAPNIVSALRLVEPNSLRSLIAQLKERAGSATELTTQVRFAASALYLADPEAAQPMLALGPDPSARTAFLLGLEGWRADLTGLPDLLRKTDDSAFRSGLCAAVGTIAYTTLTDEERKSLPAVVRELYTDAPDGGTHSAAG
jgi:hypothetical protein